MAPTTTLAPLPSWARSRIECANCGRVEFHPRSAPHRAELAFESWLVELWQDARSAQTRMGFKIWCSPRCEHLWKRGHSHYLESRSADGHAHRHRLRQEELVWEKGLAR